MYPQQGYPQQGYPQQGYPQQGYPQQCYPQAGPPQPGFQQMQAPAAVYASQPQLNQPNIIIQAAPVVGPDPQNMICPNCKNSIQTVVEDVPNTQTHLLAFCLCMFGCDLGCCLIPYCMPSCQSQKHTCPNCRFLIGVYQSS